MQVQALFIYPIKSCRGIPLECASVTLKGFEWDREFTIADPTGMFITQRQYPQLATLLVRFEGEIMVLAVDGQKSEPFYLNPTLEGRETPLQIWRTQTRAIDQGNEVANWLQSALKLKGNFRLLRQSPQYPRPVNSQYAIQGNETVSFADGYPFLIVNTASLDNLNQRLMQQYGDESQSIPMNRFRPNLVIESNDAFAEDNWDVLQIGDLTFDLVKPCDRCIVTTTDQASGHRNEQQEPLKTLSTFRRFSQAGILFGENAIPRSTGEIKTRDRVTILTHS